MSVSEVFNCDCMEYMKTLPTGYFDLAIVDPPYGINAPKMKMGTGYSNGKYTPKKLLNGGSGKLKNRILNTSDCTWDEEPPKKEYFDELFRISKNQIIWGGNYFELPPTRCIVAWDKQQPWENFSQVEIAWTSFDKPAKLFKQVNGGCTTEKKIHPTQKPIELYKYLLSRFAHKGYRIFDSHLGSGSSRIACWEYGLDFYGCEKNKKYFDDMEKRFSIVKAQGLLDFGEDQPELFECI